MKLFQYWDAPTPPDEVAGWIDGFRTQNPEFEHVLLDEAAAIEFIARHYGPRETAAFKACAVPAMQADFIRLCCIDSFGGLYVDADNQSLQPVSGLIDQAPQAMILTWYGLINNAFLMFRRPHDPFIRACLALTVENVEQRRFKTEFTSTGPGVDNAVRAVIDPSSLDEMLALFDGEAMRDWGFRELLDYAHALIRPSAELTEAFGAITFLNTLAAAPWVGAEQPAYKQGDRHWVTWKGDIYR